jgi:hypothetical protein
MRSVARHTLDQRPVTRFEADNLGFSLSAQRRDERHSQPARQQPSHNAFETELVSMNRLGSDLLLGEQSMNAAGDERH